MMQPKVGAAWITMTSATWESALNDDTKSRYGFWIILLGFAVVLVAFIFSAEKWGRDVKDVTAAMGSITGVVGTLAGAYFGVHVGAAGKERSDAARDAAQQKLERLAGNLQPEEYRRALNIE